MDQFLASQIKTEQETEWWSWFHYRSAVSHPSLVYSLRPVQRSKTVQFPKQFSHTSLCFLVDQVLASQIKTEEETSWWSWLHYGPAVSHPSLVYSSRPVQRSKTVQFPKQFSHTSLCFLVDQVVASQIKTEEEALWVKPCGSAISHPSFANSSRSFQLSVTSLFFSVDSGFF